MQRHDSVHAMWLCRHTSMPRSKAPCLREAVKNGHCPASVCQHLIFATTLLSGFHKHARETATLIPALA